MKQDIELRKEYISKGFSSLIMKYTLDLTELRGKLLLGNKKVEEKVKKLEKKIHEFEKRLQKRMADLDRRMKLHRLSPKVLGSVYVVPLTQMEYKNHYGMSRDDEVEEMAIQVAKIGRASCRERVVRAG